MYCSWHTIFKNVKSADSTGVLGQEFLVLGDSIRYTQEHTAYSYCTLLVEVVVEGVDGKMHALIRLGGR